MIPESAEVRSPAPSVDRPHRAKQDWNMTIVDGMSRCRCGRMIAEVGTVKDRHWLHVEEDWASQPPAAPSLREALDDVRLAAEANGHGWVISTDAWKRLAALASSDPGSPSESEE